VTSLLKFKLSYRSATNHGVAVTHEEPMALKMHIKVHREVLAMCSLLMEFVLVKKKHGKLYIDLYQAGPRMLPTKKRFSVELQESPCGVSEALIIQESVIVSSMAWGTRM
jgi:hypothetical protein